VPRFELVTDFVMSCGRRDTFAVFQMKFVVWSFNCSNFLSVTHRLLILGNTWHAERNKLARKLSDPFVDLFLFSVWLLVSKINVNE
jgi:hypothetical protein